jgi:hypothetical protein
LANNIREEANFSEVLILYKISDVGLWLFVNHRHLSSDDEKYFSALLALDHAVVVDRVDLLLKNKT